LNDSNIYISTLALSEKTPQQIVDIAVENNFNLEFSSGLPFYENMEQLFYDAPIQNKIPHNYFPAPKIPFVLNLASANEDIRFKSINHCINGIKLAKAVNAPFFSAHAGFCIDPKPSELGQIIKYNLGFDKKKHWLLFFDSLNKLLDFAEVNEIDFLIENNVIAPFNLVGNENPLLCCDSDEINYLFNNIRSKRLFLLLDTAHLKVSCNTLTLDLKTEFNRLKKHIKALHHSDNDGLKDSNDMLTETYWFLPFLSEFKNLVNVVEVKNISVTEIKQHINRLKDYFNN
jgi:endonuclease IV